MKQKIQKGFTLIELMVVIFIIALLASIVVVSVNNSRINARDAKRVQDIDTVNTAIQMYADANGHYPDTDGAWRSSYVYPDWVPDVVQQYLSVLPIDPINTINHTYTYVSNGTDYKLLLWWPESQTVIQKAANDGGRLNSCPSTYPPGCAYEIYSPGAQSW